ncbi:MAG TPA: hypothetical protein VIL34_14525 [Actinopolymorphaceae bacterium]|jgi:hypothetical protein
MLSDSQSMQVGTVWRLRSMAGDKVVRVVARDGDLDIVLAMADEPTPFLSMPLSHMLTISTGRPWRLEHPPLEEITVERAEPGLSIRARAGGLDVEQTWAFDHDLLRVDVTWQRAADTALPDVAVGLVLAFGELPGEKLTIPGVLYNDNPSADPSRDVPRVGVVPGGGFVCEEHRLPIPGCNLEWDGGRFLTLLSPPAYREDTAGVVTYGSMGAVRTAEGLSLVAMSGVLMFGGRPDVAYVHKSVTAPHDGGYLTFTPGAHYSRRYVLDWGVVSHPGHGFRTLVRRGRELSRDKGRRPLDLATMIRLKTNALDARWTSLGRYAGYLKFPCWGELARAGKAGRDFLYGWTGQCLRLAWCDAWIGFHSGQPDRVGRARAAVSCYVDGSGTTVDGLRFNFCVPDEDRWHGFFRDGHEVISSRAHGETLCDIADIIALFASFDAPVPDAWRGALEQGVAFACRATLAEGVPPVAWRLDGSPHSPLVCAAGLPVVSALARTYEITRDATHLHHAEAMHDRYHELHAATFDRPFGHATLDAACEDKEAGIFYFLAAYDLFRVTEREVYRERAEVALDWLLTFVYVWAPTYDRGSPLRERSFSAVGWPTVSVQNHHLDVFFPAYEMMHFGQLTGRRDLVTAADTIIHAMGQGICQAPGDWGFPVVGEQGEGFFQTHWQQRGTSNTWNPSWVIAIPLANALRMQRAAAEQ